jgi:hypothetical protein
MQAAIVGAFILYVRVHLSALNRFGLNLALTGFGKTVSRNKLLHTFDNSIATL